MHKVGKIQNYYEEGDLHYKQQVVSNCDKHHN